MKKYKVYKNISPSGKYYIDQTSRTIEIRWREICRYNFKHSRQKDSNPHLFNAIQKYGEDTWTHELLGSVDNSIDCDTLEIGYIALLKAQDSKFGYNKAKGGNKPPKQFGTPSIEHRQKISIALKGIKRGPSSRKGIHLSEKTKERISKTLKEKGIKPPNTSGRKQPKEEVARRIKTMKDLGHTRLGSIHSKEAKEKMCLAKLGKPSTRLGKSKYNTTYTHCIHCHAVIVSLRKVRKFCNHVCANRYRWRRC